MPLSKDQKLNILDDLKDKISRQKAIVLIGIVGLKVKDLSVLRSKVRDIGGSLKVVKKTLASIALKEYKLDFDKGKFKEEIAFVFGFGDEIAPAKAVYEFSKTNDKLKILGGFLENQFKTGEEVLVLAKLPSKNELLARFVGTINAPASNLVTVLQGNIKGLITVLSKIKA